MKTTDVGYNCKFRS